MRSHEIRLAINLDVKFILWCII